jgi:tetratricopeptide (TPR) repeat protein
MKRPDRHRVLAAALALLLTLPVLAAEPSAEVLAVRDQWAQAKYDTPKDQRVAALEALATKAGAARAAHPDAADALIWEGIVLSTLAGEKGGLGALGLVKQARKNFEQAIAIDPTALDGSAYTSLGSLYYQVPGWPVGFGDDDKAREMLEQGLARNPDGLDSNYFYADFLREQEDFTAAQAALLKALAAPDRPGRALADKGRRAEAEAMLAEVRKSLASP